MKTAYAFAIVAILAIATVSPVSADFIGDITSGIMQIFPGQPIQNSASPVFVEKQSLDVRIVPDTNGSGLLADIQRSVGIIPKPDFYEVEYKGQEVAKFSASSPFAKITALHNSCIPYGIGTEAWYVCETGRMP
jgi:hypothetical protein